MALNRYFLALALLVGLPSACFARVELRAGTEVLFADREQGAVILGADDAFVAAMSPFDRSARLQTESDVPKEEFLRFAALQVLPFTGAEQAKLEQVVGSIQGRLAALKLNPPLPASILVIKTTGKEEGGAPYCRDNAVVLPAAVLEAPADALEDIFIHELFHILSRNNPELRSQLYAILGFVPCTEVSLPPEIAGRKITNPDAFGNDYYVEVSLKGRRTAVIPVLLSSSAKYDVRRGGSFFRYMVLKLLAVEQKDGQWIPQLVDGKPVLADVSEAPEYLEKVGRNTGYVIHPEEVLADNFRLLVKGVAPVPTPAIPAKMKELLSR
jgi:hypothetical protein